MEILQNYLYWTRDPRDVKSLASSSFNFNKAVPIIEADASYWIVKLEVQYGLMIREKVKAKELKELYELISKNEGNFQNVFEYCYKNNKIECVSILLQNERVDPAAGDNIAIIIASEKGYLSVLERLLQDDRVDPAAEHNIAIRCASQKGQLHVVERLLQDKRVDPAADHSIAIRFASWNGQLHVVERLLQDKRVDPSAENNYAIRFASWNGHLAVVERLLQDDRVDPTAKDNYAIRFASQKCHLAVVERLLQDKRVINSLNKEQLKEYQSSI